MKTKTFTPMGALHPVLFFAGVYVVALFFSIFICSSLFYSCNSTIQQIVKKAKEQHNLVIQSSKAALWQYLHYIPLLSMLVKPYASNFFRRM